MYAYFYHLTLLLTGLETDALQFECRKYFDCWFALSGPYYGIHCLMPICECTVQLLGASLQLETPRENCLWHHQIPLQDTHDRQFNISFQFTLDISQHCLINIPLRLKVYLNVLKFVLFSRMFTRKKCVHRSKSNIQII